MATDYSRLLGRIMNSPDTTPADRERLVALLLKERDSKYVTREQVIEMMSNPKGNVSPQQRKYPLKSASPQDTATFLSLFNERNGLKYLTHDFDTEDIQFYQILERSRSIFKIYTTNLSIPQSLYALVNGFINGPDWLDLNHRKFHDGCFSKEWMEWSEHNGGRHPISELQRFAPVIQSFKHTIRIASPDLRETIDEIIEIHNDIQFECVHLEKADFFTNVRILKKQVGRLIQDMTEHKDSNQIRIEYIPGHKGDFLTRTIKMTHIGSSEKKTLKEVIDKFNKKEGGSFVERANNLRGYCHWSIESIWGEGTLRWNILRDANTKEVENIERKDIDGFSHILTFYYK